MNLNPLLLVDGYKLDHRRQYPEQTVLVYSNWTPRKSRIENANKVVLFGLQYFIKKYLISEFQTEFFSQPKEKVVAAYARRINNYLGPNLIGTAHIEALHDLGYLPIRIKALPEGSKSNIRVPQFTVVNTHPDFFWLTNYLETLMSCTVWGPSTSATLADGFREIFEYWAEQTDGDTSFIPFQGHDFSMRGMYGPEAAMMSGAGHLLSFVGTDTVPAIDWLEKYYNADSDKELIGCSVAATEHAVMCVGTGFYILDKNLTWEKYGEAELEVFKRLITETYPSGIVSIVSDTWDLWKVLGEYLPMLKDIILARDGKLVIRPDSGDPVKIITGYFDDEVIAQSDGTITINESSKQIGELEFKGVIQCLWDVFGGTTNDKGYRQLDPHVGAIYGDSITLERAEEMCLRLAENMFTSTNCVFGIGSYTYQFQTRDTFGFAMKATYAEVVRGKSIGINVFKDPVTDDGTKKSATGLIQIVATDTTPPEFHMVDKTTWAMEADSFLETVFEDGVLVKDLTLAEIRATLREYNNIPKTV